MPTEFVAQEMDHKGRFIRQKNRFTTPFGHREGQLPIEKHRYRLLVSYACPWAHRQLIVLKLLGLDQVISIGFVDPVRPTGLGRTDWAFTLDKDKKDPVLGIPYLSDIYLQTDPNYQGALLFRQLLTLRQESWSITITLT